MISGDQGMRRIVIIGSGGAGKSTLARELGEILDIEVIHLDRLYWNPGWVTTPHDEWQSVVEDLLRRDSWVMDGDYSGTLDIRIPAADTVIYMDLPRWISVWRIFKRWFQYRGRQRSDLSPGCLEKMDWEFFLWVWHFRRQRRGKILGLIERHGEGKKVFILRTPHEVERFLETARAFRES